MPDQEIRTVSSTGAEKGVKLERHDLIPYPALKALAEHYGRGAQKYAEHNWRKGYEWSKSYAAMQRHATAWWDGEDIDEETGSSHLAGVAFHVFALLTFIQEHPEFDDRFKTSAKIEAGANSSASGSCTGFGFQVSPFTPGYDELRQAFDRAILEFKTNEHRAS